MEKINNELKNLILDYIKIKKEEEILMQQIKKRTDMKNDALLKLIEEIRHENKNEITQRKKVKGKEIAKRKKEIEQSIY